MTITTHIKAVEIDNDQELQNSSAQHAPDEKCCPKSLSPNENYWYLSEKGWLPWKQVDFTKMSVGHNIFMVVYSYFSPFLDAGSFTGSSRPVWTADSACYEFARAAEELVKKFGALPENASLYPVTKRDQYTNSFAAK